MTTFKTGKIQRNADKKIDELLALATRIEFNAFVYDGRNDTPNFAKPAQVDGDFVKAFIKENEFGLNMFMSCDDGKPVDWTIRGNGGYFNITFA